MKINGNVTVVLRLLNVLLISKWGKNGENMGKRVYQYYRRNSKSKQMWKTNYVISTIEQ